jgi:hypothetical protein
MKTYPINSKVKIRDPGKKPANWNMAMMQLVGKTAMIRRVNPDAHKIYLYVLHGIRWNWRHVDLELIELPKLDPNRAFRNRRNEI